VDGRHRKALGGVGVALGVVQHLLVGPPPWPLHAGPKPVHQRRLAGASHLRQPAAKLVQAGDEAPVGLAEAHGGQLTKQQVHAVADLGLGDTDHAAGAPVRQPVQQHRGHRVQADLQRQRRGAATSGRGWWGQVGEAGGQPAKHRGGQRRARAV
jgi:hypothetical protein